MSLNREERRLLKKKIAPTAKEIARLEKAIKNGANKEEYEAEIASIMESLTLMEMMAVEDYITSKHLLDD